MPFLPYPRQPWGGGAGSKAIPGARTPPPPLRAGLMGLLGPEFKYWPERVEFVEYLLRIWVLSASQLEMAMWA